MLSIDNNKKRTPQSQLSQCGVLPYPRQKPPGLKWVIFAAVSNKLVTEQGRYFCKKLYNLCSRTITSRQVMLSLGRVPSISRFSMAQSQPSTAQSATPPKLGSGVITDGGVIIAGGVIGAGVSALFTRRAISPKRLCKKGPEQTWFENMLCLVRLPCGVPSYTNWAMPFLWQISMQRRISEACRIGNAPVRSDAIIGNADNNGLVVVCAAGRTPSSITFFYKHADSAVALNAVIIACSCCWAGKPIAQGLEPNISCRVMDCDFAYWLVAGAVFVRR